MKFSVGRKVFINGSSGFCTPSWETVTNLQTRYDEHTGAAYQLVFCRDQAYRGDTGECIEGARAYFLDVSKSASPEEPPAVTRAREILEECGIVDVQGTPAEQLRPLVELIEELNTRRLEKYNAPEPDVVMEWVSNNKAPGWPIFRGFPIFQRGEIFHCYRVTK